MSSDETTPTEQFAPPPAAQTWGAAPRQERPRWSGRRTALAVAVAVVIAGGGGAAIAAASGNASSSSATGPGGAPGRFGGMGGTGPAGSGFAVLGDALHGDFVVPKSSGGYTTERLQRGKVTASSGTSLTVASDDGYTGSYVINSSTRLENDNQTVTSIPTGQTVTVVAALSGTDDGTATATSVDEGTARPPGGGFGRPGDAAGGSGPDN